MTAPEPTPMERAAEANFLARAGWRHGDAHDAREVWQQVVLGDARGDVLRSWVDATRPIATALLGGDWLERVLGEHAVAPRTANHYRCRCGVYLANTNSMAVEYLPEHQAAAVRAVATGGVE